MTLDVVNAQNEKVGSVDLKDAVFGGPLKLDLVWASVVRQNASERRGTHMTKNRALVSGSGRKPYRQKGTGRPQVGSTRTPLWRHGGTVFGPQPRSYGYSLPRKVERGALRMALAAKMRGGELVVVDELRAEEKKTRAAVEVLQRLGVLARKGTLIVDVQPDENFTASARNIAGVRIVASGRLTARDLASCGRVIATRAAVERLQEVLG
jgi:large subunit ribosomal protein L4